MKLYAVSVLDDMDEVNYLTVSDKTEEDRNGQKKKNGISRRLFK